MILNIEFYISPNQIQMDYSKSALYSSAVVKNYIVHSLFTQPYMNSEWGLSRGYLHLKSLMNE